MKYGLKDTISMVWNMGMKRQLSRMVKEKKYITTMQDRNTLNEQGERHGYWEIYHENGQISFKTLYSNGKICGPYEKYFDNGVLDYKVNIVNNDFLGYYEFNILQFKSIDKTYYAR
jgi:antitoxin component YwqK of YwqJK toxin-antitoxin module